MPLAPLAIQIHATTSTLQVGRLDFTAGLIDAKEVVVRDYVKVVSGQGYARVQNVADTLLRALARTCAQLGFAIHLQHLHRVKELNMDRMTLAPRSRLEMQASSTLLLHPGSSPQTHSSRVLPPHPPTTPAKQMLQYM